MSVTIISLVPSRYATSKGATPYDLDTWVFEAEIYVENLYQARNGRPFRHALHFGGADGVRRTVTGGPLSSEPHALLVPLATVISDRPLPVVPSLSVGIGDVLVDAKLGVVLRVVAGGRNADTKVEVIEAPAPTVDYSAFIAEVNARPIPYQSESYLSS
jgi:hypothetical protein